MPEPASEPADPAIVWQQYLASLPKSFASLVSLDLQVASVTLSVHQDLLCLHSEIFSDLLESCAKPATGGRPAIPLLDDSPKDAVSFLVLLYDQAKGATHGRLATICQAVEAARFSHKYASTLQLQACDQYLQEKVGSLQDEATANQQDKHGAPAEALIVSKTKPSWTSLQWVTFCEQHGLSRTLASWECWAIEQFDSLKQDISEPPQQH